MGDPEPDAKFYSIVRRGILVLAATCWVAIVWFGLGRFGLGEEPPKKTESDFREAIDRIAKGYELFLGADSIPLEMEAEPVLRWPNATRETQEGATYLWTLDGRPEAIGCVWETGGRWFHEFHSLSSSNLVAKYNKRIIWQPEKAGIEFRRFPKAPNPADSAVKRLVQMKDLAQQLKCRLNRSDAKSEELRFLPRPLYRYKTGRKDLVDGALFAFVHGTDPEVVLVLEAALRDGKSEWRYALTRSTAFAVEADLDDKTIWSVPDNVGGRNATWFTGSMPKIN
jgi:hypothetical protein